MISQKRINECSDILRSVYNPTKMYLFGSYAWGTPTDESDLDYLVVVKESSEPNYKRIVRGERALFKKKVMIPTDIMVSTEAEFQERSATAFTLYNKIKNEGVLLETI